MKNNSKGQALVLVLIIVTIFASIIVTIGSLTARELEMREVDEMSVNSNYASETGYERARALLKRGYALRFDGINDYINVGAETTPLFDPSDTTYEQFTIETWFKIDNFKTGYGMSPVVTRGSTSSTTCTGAPPGYPLIGSPYKGCMEGSLAVSGTSGPPIGTFGGGPLLGCSRTLHFAAKGTDGKYYWIPVLKSGATNPLRQVCNLTLQTNKWYHVSLVYVGIGSTLGQGSWFAFMNGVNFDDWSDWNETWQFTSSNNQSHQSGTYNIRIGTSMNNNSYFDGEIDEVRIYKHPRYCGGLYFSSVPTFWNKSFPGDFTHPDDPGNHLAGNYGYQDNIPGCSLASCVSAGVCASSVWNTDPNYYPSTYNMETHDLELFYNFEEKNTCTLEGGTECIIDNSPGGTNDGTPSGFTAGDANSGWYVPGAPNSKHPITNVTNLIHVDENDTIGNCGTSGVDCDPMSNKYSYSFDIIPNSQDINGNSCSCSPVATGCCCHNYCIQTSGKSP